MARGIVEEKQALGPSLCDALKYVDGMIDLLEQVAG